MDRTRPDLYDSNIMHAPGAKAPTIRSYALFGEAGDLPDVLHCETIAARSVLHDWELARHRHHRLHQLLWLQQGQGTAWLEAGPAPLGSHTLVNVPTGEVHAFAFSPGTQGWVVSLPDELVDAQLAAIPEARSLVSRASAQTVDEASAATLGTLLAALTEAFVAPLHPARALVLCGLGTAVLGLAAQALGVAQAEAVDLAGSRLLRRFESLLERHFASAWRVSDYAAALAVTPTHLSRVARVATGLPISRLVDARRMREARRHLAYTTASVTAVGEALGFEDPAHFSRVFARTCGCSPREFRARVSQPATVGEAAAPTTAAA